MFFFFFFCWFCVSLNNMNIPLRKYLDYHKQWSPYSISSNTLQIRSPFFSTDARSQPVRTTASDWFLRGLLLGRSIGAQRIKRREKSAAGLPQDGPLPWQKVSFPQNVWFSLFNSSTPRGGHIPTEISSKVLHYLLKCLSTMIPRLFCTPLTQHAPPPTKWIIPAGVCRQVLLGVLVC